MFTNSGVPRAYNAIPAQSGNIELTIEDIAIDLVHLGSSSYAIIQIQDNSIRYWLNGATPTVSEGFIANNGDKITIELAELKAGVKFISAALASPAKVVVQFYNN